LSSCLSCRKNNEQTLNSIKNLTNKPSILYPKSMNLETQVITALIDQNLTLALAESCTGGLLGHRLTNISGSSKAIQASLVTYSNEAKNMILDISKQVIEQKGAVSDEVATQMAQNVREKLKANFGIGISGIAGPSGGTKSKPVGLTYICVCTEKESLTLKCVFPGSREKVKKQAADKALEILLEFLETPA